MRLCDRIGLESSPLQHNHGFQRQAQNVGALVNPSFSEYYFWSFSRWKLSGEQTVIHYRILSFPCNVTFMNSVCHCFDSLSCKFICFSNTTESCLCFRCFKFSRFRNNGFPNAGFGEFSVPWHHCCHWCLQLSPCILNDVFVILIDWINRIISLQISGVFEFWFLDCLFLLLSSLRGFSNSRPSVRPCVIWR